MNMRAAVRVCVFLLVLALGLPLTGCGEAQKMREYNQGILTAGTAINEATMHFNDAFEAFKREYSAEHRDALIQAAGELNDAYQLLGSLEAPEKYSQVQDCYRESADLIKKAVEGYQEQLGSIVSASDITEDIVWEMQDIDDYLSQAREKLMEGSELGQAINEEN